MSYEPTPQDDSAGDLAARELEELLDSLARLAGSDLPAPQFYQALLEGAVRGLAAVAGAIWGRDPAGQIRVECQVQFDRLVLAQNWADAQRHTHLVESMLSSGESRLVPPRSTLPGASSALNPSEYLLVLAPVAMEAGGTGLVEVFQRASAAPLSQQGSLNFLAAICDLAAEYQRNFQLRGLRDRETLWGQFERFTQNVHASLDSKTVGYTIVNDGRGLIGCDRISVAMARGKGARMLAISGLDQFDRRSEAVRRLEQLAARVAATHEPLWHAAGEVDFAPQIQAPLEAVLDETHARAIAVIPLFAPESKNRESGDHPANVHDAGRLLGSLIVERFEGGGFGEAERQRIGAVARQSAAALRNAQTYQRVPLSPLWRALERIGWLGRARQLPKTALALSAVAIAVAALVFIPADFDISARGELQPQHRREVFARSDGIVDEVKVSHGDAVAAGAVLVTLRKPQLDFESSRLDGEFNDAQTKLSGIQASLTSAGRDASANSPEKINQLSAEGEEVKSLLESLKRQRSVLDKQRDDLKLLSPMAGTVLTWDAANLLSARPVGRGQALLTVAQLDGPWEIEAQVADNRIGHVIAAENERHRDRPDSELSASFRMATDPSATHEGQVRRVAMSTESDKTTGSTVLVTIDIDRANLPGAQLRPGATAIVKIHCGRRSLGYVWLHEFWEMFQSRVLF